MSSTTPPKHRRVSPLLLRGVFVVVVSLVSAALVAPFYMARHKADPVSGQTSRLLSTHDMAAHFGVMESFDKMLRAGIAYPRWLADMNRGYGSATTNYYPPGFYYLTSLVNLVFGNWVNTLFAISVLVLAGSGLAFYQLSRLFAGKAASIVGSLVYMLLPYHLLDLYWRGALPEYVSFAIMPLCFYFAFKVGAEGRGRDYAGLAITHALFLMTELPIGYLATYVMAFYAIAWGIKERRVMAPIRIAAGLGLGLTVSAIYWLPAALEQQYAFEWATALFPYHKTYITLLEGKEAFDSLINATFVFQVVMLAAAIFVLRHKPRSADGPELKGEKRSDRIIQGNLWILMAVVTTFMATSFSIYISKLIPKIQVANPAWRWLALAALFTALVLAFALEHVRPDRQDPTWRIWTLRGVLAASVAMNLVLSAKSVVLAALDNPSLSMSTIGIETAYTPRGSTPPDKMPDVPLAWIERAPGTAEVRLWEPEQREIWTDSAGGDLKLKTYNFQGWTARIDGRAADVLRDFNGLQTISLPPGQHKVEVRFEDTPPRQAGRAISCAGILVVCSLWVGGYLRMRKRRSTRTG